MFRKWLWGLLVLWLAGCSATPTSSPTPQPSPTLGWTPQPYLTPTPSPSPTPGPLVLPTPALPSPTPFTYTVAKGDTMLGIALRFGVSLEALQEANPGVNPTAMSVGTTLIIPLNPDNPAALPSPTPLPLRIGQPFCEPSADGSVVCLVTVTNDTNQAVEAVAARLVLNDGQQQVAEALVNLLPPHRSTALVARFGPPAPAQPTARAQILRALPLTSAQKSQRYLPIEIAQSQTTIAADQHAATIEGELTFTQPTQAPKAEVWVVATAYDAQGRPVGVRRWETLTQPTPDQPLPFSLTVYSIGPAIAQVELLAEAHPPAATPTP